LRTGRIAVVAVHGTARVCAEIALLLAAAGIGTIACLDTNALRQCDLSPGGLARMAAGRRGDITALRASRFTQTVRTTVDRPERVTLAILAPPAAEALPEIVTSVRDEPHLLACVRETTGLVGPLVVPGRTPCLRCVALARGDRDPHWPALSAQLVGTRTAEPCDVALAGLVASLAALEALAFIDGNAEPATAGGVLEYPLGTGALRRRTVRAHPACGCGAGRDEVLADAS
jgi:bacteriocin biosynthesis cyclodehydratase domain-containing protein